MGEDGVSQKGFRETRREIRHYKYEREGKLPGEKVATFSIEVSCPKVYFIDNMAAKRGKI